MAKTPYSEVKPSGFKSNVYTDELSDDSQLLRVLGPHVCHLQCWYSDCAVRTWEHDTWPDLHMLSVSERWSLNGPISQNMPMFGENHSSSEVTSKAPILVPFVPFLSQVSVSPCAFKY